MKEEFVPTTVPEESQKKLLFDDEKQKSFTLDELIEKKRKEMADVHERKVYLSLMIDRTNDKLQELREEKRKIESDLRVIKDDYREMLIDKMDKEEK